MFIELALQFIKAWSKKRVNPNRRRLRQRGRHKSRDWQRLAARPYRWRHHCRSSRWQQAPILSPFPWPLVQRL